MKYYLQFTTVYDKLKHVVKIDGPLLPEWYSRTSKI